MRVRVLALAAAAAVTAAVMPAHAGTVKPQIVDPTGDANGVNGQPETVGGPNPNVSSGPASYAADDIVAVSFATNFVTKKVKRKTVKTPTGFTATLTLAGAPDLSYSYYAVRATTATCPDGITFEYSKERSPFGFDDVTCFAASGASGSFNDYPATPAAVKGNTISWTVPLSGMKAGTVLKDLSAFAGIGFVGSMPTLDQAESSATFTVGK
jgi:hypothetical protein